MLLLVHRGQKGGSNICLLALLMRCCVRVGSIIVQQSWCTAVKGLVPWAVWHNSSVVAFLFSIFYFNSPSFPSQCLHQHKPGVMLNLYDKFFSFFSGIY